MREAREKMEKEKDKKLQELLDAQKTGQSLSLLQTKLYVEGLLFPQGNFFDGFWTFSELLQVVRLNVVFVTCIPLQSCATVCSFLI